MFREHELLHARAAKTYCDEQRQFAAPLQHIAQHHDAQPGAAEEEPQSTEHLEGAEICILHRVKCREPLRGGRGFEPIVLQGPRQFRAHLRDGVRRAVDEEHSRAAHAGETPLEFGFIHNQ